jgi:hypothetical protein
LDVGQSFVRVWEVGKERNFKETKHSKKVRLFKRFNGNYGTLDNHETKRDYLDHKYFITQSWGRIVVCTYICQAMAWSNKQSNLVEKGDLSPLTTKL